MTVTNTSLAGGGGGGYQRNQGKAFNSTSLDSQLTSSKATAAVAEATGAPAAEVTLEVVVDTPAAAAREDTLVANKVVVVEVATRASSNRVAAASGRSSSPRLNLHHSRSSMIKK